MERAADDFPVSFAILELARRHRAFAAELLRDLGLHLGQELMLMALWERDGQSQNSLGRALSVDHSTVAKSLRRLEDAGLVTRSRSERDRRSTIVHLTPAGRDLETAVLEVWAKLEDATAHDFTAEDRGRLVTLVRRAAANIEAATRGPLCRDTDAPRGA